VGDLDLVASESRPGAALEALQASRRVAGPAGRGGTLVDLPLRVELWSGPPDSLGNRLQHATGSAAHNVRLRERAVRMGMSVSEHGIRMADGTTRTHADEAGVYAELGLEWIPAELREDDGEIEASERGRLPRLVSLEDVRGDLHVHTDWSDGRLDLPGMAAAAAARGYAYLAISDHSQRLRMAGGLDPERVRRQWEVIDRMNRDGAPLVLLKATEVDILADGLDFEDDLLAGFDWVTASVHSGFQASGERYTERLLRAIESPHVDAIGHPTGRMLGRRTAAAIDVDRVVEAAARTGTALEVNGQPQRLDLDAATAARALAAGVRLQLSSDAHSAAELGMVAHAVKLARRAGARAEDVVNATEDPPGQRARR
jgi:DNA polymerase (family 10)